MVLLYTYFLVPRDGLFSSFSQNTHGSFDRVLPVNCGRKVLEEYIFLSHFTVAQPVFALQRLSLQPRRVVQVP